MTNLPTAYIFPAFSSDIPDNPACNLPDFDSIFSRDLHRAKHTFPWLSTSLLTERNNPHSELATQLLTYIYSHSVAESLESVTGETHWTAGYSMGIYAALCHAGCISFETGLFLIHKAYECSLLTTRHTWWGMATIIGLSRSDLVQIIQEGAHGVEITNQNAEVSFVLSGPRIELDRLMEVARIEGALHVRDLGVNIPYHSASLKPAADLFGESIKHLEFSDPVFNIISLIDGRVIGNGQDARDELRYNLYQPLNWLNTMNILLDKKIRIFVECGPPTGLVRNAGFIEGDFRFLLPGDYYRQMKS